MCVLQTSAFLQKSITLHRFAEAGATTIFCWTTGNLRWPKKLEAGLRALAADFHLPGAKPPFAGPEEVLKYVARYTHRVAIPNDRLLGLDDGKVQFRWKDCCDNSRHKTMTLAAEEVIRRLLLHVLPEGFQRIRYYSFLANRYGAEKLALCRQLLQTPPLAANVEVKKNYRDRYEEITGVSLKTCPLCRHSTMIVIETFECAASRAPRMDTS